MEDYDGMDYDIAIAFNCKPNILYTKFRKIGFFKSNILTKAVFSYSRKKRKQALRIFNNIEY